MSDDEMRELMRECGILDVPMPSDEEDENEEDMNDAE